MKMRFPGKCIECGEAIAVGQAGMWLKGTGVKHERCGAAAESGDVRSGGGGGGGGGGGELRCLVCGKPAGCPACEFSDSCDTAAVSQLCMCYDCMGDKDTYALYRAAASRKFPGLEPKVAEHVSDGDWSGGGGDEAAGGAAGGRAGGRGASAAGAGGKDAGGLRGVSAGGQSKLAHGGLREVDVDGGGGRAKKRRGSASGQQRL